MLNKPCLVFLNDHVNQQKLFEINRYITYDFGFKFLKTFCFNDDPDIRPFVPGRFIKPYQNALLNEFTWFYNAGSMFAPPMVLVCMGTFETMWKMAFSKMILERLKGTTLVVFSTAPLFQEYMRFKLDTKGVWLDVRGQKQNACKLDLVNIVLPLTRFEFVFNNKMVHDVSIDSVMDNVPEAQCFTNTIDIKTSDTLFCRCK